MTTVNLRSPGGGAAQQSGQLEQTLSGMLTRLGINLTAGQQQSAAPAPAFAAPPSGLTDSGPPGAGPQLFGGFRTGGNRPRRRTNNPLRSSAGSFDIPVAGRASNNTRAIPTQLQRPQSVRNRTTGASAQSTMGLSQFS